MAGWRSRARSCASRAKRATAGRVGPTSTLIAAGRPVWRSRARNTWPMPPAPIRRSMTKRSPMVCPGASIALSNPGRSGQCKEGAGGDGPMRRASLRGVAGRPGPGEGGAPAPGGRCWGLQAPRLEVAADHLDDAVRVGHRALVARVLAHVDHGAVVAAGADGDRVAGVRLAQRGVAVAVA